MIPFLLLIALAAQAMGILNARNYFGIPALASAFFNIGSIVGGLLLGFGLGPAVSLSPIEGLAYGTLVGGFLQFAVQWPSLIRTGFSYRPMISFTDPGVHQIVRLMGPVVIGTAAVQVNVFVNTNFASSIIDSTTGAVANGPVSWLNYAFRFMQLPIRAAVGAGYDIFSSDDFGMLHQRPAIEHGCSIKSRYCPYLRSRFSRLQLPPSSTGTVK